MQALAAHYPQAEREQRHACKGLLPADQPNAFSLTLMTPAWRGL